MGIYPYPPARRIDVVENHHGELVSDPYRWMEDTDDPAVSEWVAAQNRLTEQVLTQSTAREAIRAEVARLWDYPKAGVPFERGGKWFQTRNTGLQDQPVLWVGASPLDPSARMLIDPNGISADGTVALTGLEVSPDGRLAAYAVSAAGSDWMTWRVRVIATCRDLDDEVKWSKFSRASWRADCSGFYYSGTSAPSAGTELSAETRGLRVMWHELGTDQSSDTVVFEAPTEPDWIPVAEVTDDDRYLVVSVGSGTARENRLLVIDLADAGSELVPLADDFSARVVYVCNDGPSFVLMTDLDAERGRVVRAEIGEDNGSPWQELVAEAQDTLLEVHACGGSLVCHYLQDAHSRLEIFDARGAAVREIPLPGYVSLAADPLGHGAVEGRPSRDVLHYQVVSFSEPGSIWSHSIRQGTTGLVSRPGSRLDASRFVTEQVFVESSDGTRVPIFLTHREDVLPSGEVPVLLYGYGGFDIPLTPSFSVTFATWIERGGLLAVANLRGGGEYGRSWHDAGRLANKQNVFEDFCACARWFSSSGWSRPERIGIWGGSNGGLLVGACVTQRPELFGAAVADVGVFDMLRFHLFTIGWAWKSDFGDPADPEQYGWLRAYSPLHNAEAGRCYPPTLIMTGDHDDRVVPGHSFKFAATLQAAQACDAPILLRVETSAGHGFGKPTSKLVEEAADRLTFLDLALAERPRHA